MNLVAIAVRLFALLLLGAVIIISVPLTILLFAIRFSIVASGQLSSFVLGLLSLRK